MFGTVLVANRGEIAVRVTRTLRALGIRPVVVHTDADRGARHVAGADLAVRVRSYLDVEEVVGAAVAGGADALHPGYGFLAENPALARACAAAGVTFVGPPVRALEVMADKVAAKAAVAAAGVPVVAGTDRADLDDEALVGAALRLGLPVLVKAAAGGGGRGMRRVTDAAQLAGAIAAARREATAAFGDGRLLLERLVSPARHLEVQILADAHGRVLALGDRECSLQRRHQKLMEEAPAPGLDPAVRAALARDAVAAAASCGYVGAGTVELLAPAGRPAEHAFMEMNTRLQVEHPVTEAVTGLDLVEWQLRVAAGEPLPWDDVPPSRGHAVEARICAEDPDRGFLPSAGTVAALAEPAGLAHVRVDSALAPGSVIGTDYDPLLGKVVAWGEDRPEALARLGAALAATTVLGVATNTGFLRRLLAHPDVAAGRLDTDLVERVAPSLAAAAHAADGEALVAAALAAHLAPGPAATGRDPWDQRDGWRVGGAAGAVTTWVACGRRTRVGLLGGPEPGPVPWWAGRATVGDGPARPVRARLGPASLLLELDGRAATWSWALDGAAVWVGRAGDTWALHPDRTGTPAAGRRAGAAGPLRSPLPGRVLAVHVAPGEAVRAGQPLVTVEAMKMEHVVAATAAGRASAILVRAGDAVRLDQELVVVTGDGEPEDEREDTAHGPDPA